MSIVNIIHRMDHHFTSFHYDISHTTLDYLRFRFDSSQMIESSLEFGWLKRAKKRKLRMPMRET